MIYFIAETATRYAFLSEAKMIDFSLLMKREIGILHLEARWMSDRITIWCFLAPGSRAIPVCRQLPYGEIALVEASYDFRANALFVLS